MHGDVVPGRHGGLLRLVPGRRDVAVRPLENHQRLLPRRGQSGEVLPLRVGARHVAVERALRPLAGKALRGLIEERQMARLSPARSEEHTSELQSLMRISYAVFCSKTKNKQ